MINIGLLGLGTVGSGVVEILEQRKKELKHLTGEEIHLKKILVKDINKKRDIGLKENIITSNFEDILGDKDISIVVEVTGDLDRSYKYIKESLNAGKHVVTANKAVVSKYFEEFSDLASEKRLAFLYEASVGGGIPVLKPLRETIALNQSTQVQGILNGTCNYILTRMVDEGKEYKEILRIAQELGYAEADPTADVEGHDTLRKLRILGTLAFQGKINEEDILLDGISSITLADVENIKDMNSTVKLIAEAKALDDNFTAIVQPMIIKKDSYFASVDMAFNSITFKGDNVGELKFYGAGAGKLPTANAVLSDVLDIINNSYRKGNPLGGKKLQNINSSIKDRYYLRISTTDADVINYLQDITDTVLNNKDGLAIITKEMFLRDLLEMLKSHGVTKDKYFIARIMS